LWLAADARDAADVLAGPDLAPDLAGRELAALDLAVPDLAGRELAALDLAVPDLAGRELDELAEIATLPGLPVLARLAELTEDSLAGAELPVLAHASVPAATTAAAPAAPATIGIRRTANNPLQRHKCEHTAKSLNTG
jgi:hypothetical protein